MDLTGTTPGGPSNMEMAPFWMLLVPNIAPRRVVFPHPLAPKRQYLIRNKTNYKIIFCFKDFFFGTFSNSVFKKSLLTLCLL